MSFRDEWDVHPARGQAPTWMEKGLGHWRQMVWEGREKPRQEAEEDRGAGGAGAGHILAEPQHQMRHHSQVGWCFVAGMENLKFKVIG